MDTSIESTLFSYLSGEISTQDFALWVYANGIQLAKELSEPFYVALLAFDYKMKGASKQLRQILENHLLPCQYETWRITHLLSQLKSVSTQESIFEILHDIYEEAYGLGSYAFLKRIGVQYVMLADHIPAFRYEEYPRWNDGSFKVEEDLLEHHLKYIRQEAQKIQLALQQGKIRITEKSDYLIDTELEKELLSKENWNIVPPPKEVTTQPGTTKSFFKKRSSSSLND